MPPHSTILFPPHVSIEYGAYNNEPYSDDWIRFYTDEPYITKGTLPLQKPFKTLEHNYINHLFCMIAAENFFDNKFKEKTIQSLFTILIYKLTESYLSESCDFLTLSLNQLHLNIQNNPAFPWTISYMANQLHVCPRHLHKLYKSTFGTSCMDDVIIHRTLFAKDLLKTTNHSIQEIALKCGYGNSEQIGRASRRERVLRLV